MEGYLFKWTNYIWGWCARYFVLKGNVLYYFLKKGEKPKGRFYLGVCSINTSEDITRFEIDTGFNIIYLKASTTEEKEQWVKSIKAAKREADKLIQNSNTGNVCLVNINQENENRLENDENNNRYSSNTEDKLIKKINLIMNTNNMLVKNNNKFSEILNKNDLNEINKIEELKMLCNVYKTQVSSMNNQLEDLKKISVKINRDIFKISEYFFNPNGFDIAGPENITSNANKNLSLNSNPNLNNFDNNNLLYDNNVIEMVRSRAGPQKRNTSQNSLPLNKINIDDCLITKNIFEKDEEVFYGADEDDLDIQENKQDYKINIEINKEITQTSDLNTLNNGVRKTPHNIFFDEIYNHKRTNLPTKREKLNLNVWKILKDAIGKDLSKFCVPG